MNKGAGHRPVPSERSSEGATWSPPDDSPASEPARGHSRSYQSFAERIIITASPHESRVALLEDNQLVELMFDRPDQGRVVGDIYLGRVEAVLPGIQAAFVDIGAEKSGFLHVSDVMQDDDEEDSDNGRGRKNRKYPPIQDVLKKGDQVTVQVTKEPISTKGPRITAQVSLPGRFLVYMPFSSHVGVSRKIDDRAERSRLRALAKKIVPANSGRRHRSGQSGRRPTRSASRRSSSGSTTPGRRSSAKPIP